jgi:hypothetical protein
MTGLSLRKGGFPAAETFCIVGLAILLAAAFSSSLTYSKYFCLPFFLLSIALSLNLKKSTLFGENNRVLCYLFLILFSLINVRQFQFQSLADLIFISIPVIVVIAYNRYEIRPSLIIFLSLCYTIFALIDGNASFDLTKNVILNSDFSNIESNACFLFFFLFLYFFLSGNKILALISLMGMMLFFRRTVLIGFIVLIVMLLARKLFGDRKLSYMTSPVVMVLVNLGLVVMFYFVATGFFDEFVHDFTGQSIGHFTQGRTTFLKGVLDYISVNYFDLLTSGIGIGNTRPAVLSSTGYDLMLHNDIIKVFIENGIFGFSIFIYLLYRKSKFNERVVLLCFNAFLIFTNMFIYSDIVAVMFLICSKLAVNPESKLSLPATAERYKISVS